MLTKDLLRVSRAGGGYHLQFAGREHRPLAAKVLGTFEDHVGDPRSELDGALADLEGEYDFKLVRGLAKLLEREATFETRAAVSPARARRAAFEAGEALLVANDDDRERALSRAADSLGIAPDRLDRALYADREERQVLVALDDRYDPDALLAQYDLSLAQTALFDAREIRIRSDDPRRLVSATKRLGLLYEVRKTGSGRELLVTGPDALFRATRRYGTRFARLLRAVVEAGEWELTATIDDHGTERTLELSDADPLRSPDSEPVVEVSYDSAVEREFATRFSALDLDWDLQREPEPLEVGASVMIPDFAFDYAHAEFRVHFEIMGFWTPEYVAKKLDQLDRVEDVELLVAVDESLGVGEAIEARDHRVIPYSGTVRIKDVRDALRRYEERLVAASAASLPEALSPEADALSIAALAARHGVSEDALADIDFPEHELVGRTLVRPAVLGRLAERLETGQSLSEAESVLAKAGITETSAVLSRLGYRVEWDGLSGGRLRSAEE
ncbi:DUF790 family protein [Halalkalicoccus jeotgali]|uniref:DUF790 family protein n=1 Tax=Halalkalicoccus jeotgali (strain DSM 18796 / CECT 7217 / JCM 14584 / KCTC 4019 / B3) TaxID=795797 RepID=D8J6S2_HALJB|nr:DUF790 family protein [Halalkalicoccus jeotgali]ADJ15875.1 hypothetical protein HacjB3_12470 [Halalkalicoccus jeotgali B3]ELY37971.1 hypothetical protein C497_07664 [Halalkalicoccus jeotgali B3]